MIIRYLNIPFLCISESFVYPEISWYMWAGLQLLASLYILLIRTCATSSLTLFFWFLSQSIVEAIWHNNGYKLRPKISYPHKCILSGCRNNEFWTTLMPIIFFDVCKGWRCEYKNVQSVFSSTLISLIFSSILDNMNKRDWVLVVRPKWDRKW